jgi:hypothetical protein
MGFLGLSVNLRLTERPRNPIKFKNTVVNQHNLIFKLNSKNHWIHVDSKCFNNLVCNPLTELFTKEETSSNFQVKQ